MEKIKVAQQRRTYTNILKAETKNWLWATSPPFQKKNVWATENWFWVCLNIKTQSTPKKIFSFPTFFLLLFAHLLQPTLKPGYPVLSQNFFLQFLPSLRKNIPFFTELLFPSFFQPPLNYLNQYSLMVPKFICKQIHFLNWANLYVFLAKV